MEASMETATEPTTAEKRPHEDEANGDGENGVAKKPKTGGRYSMSGPVTITDLSVFECPACEKFLHEPIIMCHEGHNVCQRCLPAGNKPKCPVEGCDIPRPHMKNVALQNLIRMVRLPVACGNHVAGCEFEDTHADIEHHTKRCPYREIRCQVLNCYQTLRSQDIEEHMASAHADLEENKWNIIEVKRQPVSKGSNKTVPVEPCAPMCASLKKYFAIKSWRQDNVRFFATVFVDPYSWVLWTTAALSDSEAEKFKAEIKLSSAKEKSVLLFSAPVLSLDSPLLEDSRNFGAGLDHSPCLTVYSSFVKRFTMGQNALEEGMEIPITFTVSKAGE